MAMDPASISAISALAGSFIGALASVTTSWFTHHSQSRSERFKQEAARREQLFGAFVDQASQAYAEWRYPARSRQSGAARPALLDDQQASTFRHGRHRCIGGIRP